MRHQRLGRRLLLAGLLAAAAASAGPVRVVVADAWTRPAAAGMNAAGYMIIANRGPLPDRLTGATSPMAARVSLHQSRMIGNLSVMRPVSTIPAPPNGRTSLAPGGYHLMLESLKRPLRLGDRAPVTLIFQRAGPVRAWLIVRANAAVSPGMTM